MKSVKPLKRPSLKQELRKQLKPISRYQQQMLVINPLILKRVVMMISKLLVRLSSRVGLVFGG